MSVQRRVTFQEFSASVTDNLIEKCENYRKQFDALVEVSSDLLFNVKDRKLSMQSLVLYQLNLKFNRLMLNISVQDDSINAQKSTQEVIKNLWICKKVARKMVIGIKRCQLIFQQTESQVLESGKTKLMFQWMKDSEELKELLTCTKEVQICKQIADNYQVRIEYYERVKNLYLYDTSQKICDELSAKIHSLTYLIDNLKKLTDSIPNLKTFKNAEKAKKNIVKTHWRAFKLASNIIHSSPQN